MGLPYSGFGLINYSCNFFINNYAMIKKKLDFIQTVGYLGYLISCLIIFYLYTYILKMLF